MNILAIESSCDETAAAIISGDPDSLLATPDSNSTAAPSTSSAARPTILSNIVVSQIDIFKAYGGVIPEVAARSHLEAILPVIHQAFQEAGFTKPVDTLSKTSHPADTSSNFTTNPKITTDDWTKIDAIAVTHTPGLLGSLLIGTLTARTLAILHKKPLYAVHHLKSHIYANWLPDKTTSTSPTPTFPLLALVISGGHTQIIYMKHHNHFEIIGTTLDDAVGECFDKVAKILGLPYPGGPSIAKAATGEIIGVDPQAKTIKTSPGNPKKYPLPHPKIQGLDFSFSGLKTAVLRAVQKEVGVPISYPSHQLADLLTAEQKANFAASFEQTAIEILLSKLGKSLTDYPDAKSIVIAGGVSANHHLREQASRRFSNPESIATTASPNSTTVTPSVFFPALKFSGDNAAMVGAAALYEIASGTEPTDPYSLNIFPRSDII